MPKPGSAELWDERQAKIRVTAMAQFRQNCL